MDPSNSRSGPRYVNAPKNYFLNTVFQKEEKRASREFNGGWSRASTSGRVSSTTGTRLGFGETSVKLKRNRPQSAVNTRRPSVGLMFTVKPQLAGIHVPKRYNLDNPVSLSSSSQVSLLLRSIPNTGSESTAPADKKQLSRWRQELQQEIRRVDEQIGQNTSRLAANYMASSESFKEEHHHEPQTDEATTTTTSTFTTTTIEDAAADAAANAADAAANAADAKTADAAAGEAAGEARETAAGQATNFTHTTIDNNDDITDSTTPPPQSSSPASQNPSSPHNNVVFNHTDQGDAISARIPRASPLRRPMSAHSIRPSSARHSRGGGGVGSHLGPETIKTARFMPRPSSARSRTSVRSARSNSSNQSFTHDAMNGNKSRAVGSARKAVEARRQRPQSAASLRSLPMSLAAAAAYEEAGQQRQEGRADQIEEEGEEHHCSGTVMTGRMSVSKLTGRSEARSEARSDARSRKSSGSRHQQDTTTTTTGRLYRRAPSSRKEATELGPGMWYVWDAKRKSGSMRRGYKSTRRVEGFKNRFSTTAVADFGQKSYSASYLLKTPVHGRRKTMLR